MDPYMNPVSIYRINGKLRIEKMLIYRWLRKTGNKIFKGDFRIFPLKIRLPLLMQEV